MRTVAEGEAFEKAVELALQAPELARARVVTKALLFLAEAARADRTVTQYEVAERLYGDPGESARARATIGNLRRRLARHHASHGDVDGWVLGVPVGEYRLELEPVAALDVEEPSERAGRSKGRNWRRLLPLTIGLLVATVALAYSQRKTGPGVHSVEVSGRSLVGRSRHGEALWVREFPWPLLRSEGAAFDLRHRIVDLDGDGGREAVTAPSRMDSRWAETIWAFESDGRLRWRADLARTMRFGGRSHPPAYQTIGIWPFRKAHGVGRELVVSLGHEASFAGSVVRLSAEGEELSRYWHAGHLSSFVAWDADADGEEELVLAGCNNAFNEAAFVILEPDFASGGWPGPAGHDQTPDVAPSPDQRYVSLGRPRDVDWPVRANVHSVRLRGDRLQVLVNIDRGANLTYLFDHELNVEIRHEKAFADWWSDQRTLGHDERTLDELLQDLATIGTRVWEEGAWRAGPS